MKTLLLRSSLALCLATALPGNAAAQTTPARHTFSIGDEAFLLDGKPFVIRTGEMHFTRVPHEYWRHRLKLLPNGNSIPHQDWTIAYVDSEEKAGEDGSASNAIDGQSANFWHTEWKNQQPKHPHRLVIDLGPETRIGGFRYTPRAGADNPGRIKDYRVYIGKSLVIPATR